MDLQISEDEYKFLNAYRAETNTEIAKVVGVAYPLLDPLEFGRVLAHHDMFFFKLGQMYELSRQE